MHQTDEQTLQYYRDNATEVFERYETVTQSGIAEYFTSSFLPGSRVLDVGAGSGRDLRKLLELGFDAYGAEPTAELRDLAITRHPHLEKRLFEGSLPSNLTSYQKYDAVVCSAVLMHIPQNQLFDSILALRDLLTEQGRLLISIPASRTDVSDDARDANGRLFNPITPEQLKLLCKRLAFECMAEHVSDDGLQRKGTSWHTLLFVRRSATGKPLDRIESVLRNDRKTASYKLALMRAFCDVAEQDDHAVDWNPNGTIAIPVYRIAELWLSYYWPLVSNTELIPQNNSEAKGVNAIAFRGHVVALIELASQHFHVNDKSSQELFSVFMLAWKSNRLPKEIQQQLKRTLGKIRSAIINGPVRFASGGDMFAHDQSNDTISVDAELWLEFCLTGYWVRDSLIMRWAELCRQFGATLHHVHIGLVMERLIMKPEVEREQRIARRIYLEKQDLRCVWTEKPLTPARLDIDHALPYSLWQNNDLWNLLPADKKVNGQKRDRIPNSDMLLSSMERIIDNWQFTQLHEPAMFEFEVTRTLGEFSAKYWEKPLFDHMKRKAEVAIFQRGARVWGDKTVTAS
jgi:2-polyprenyl-3-methyl-5-hydroxy-6-metoxy-1,4-benzoquinol methylase